MLAVGCCKRMAWGLVLVACALGPLISGCGGDKGTSRNNVKVSGKASPISQTGLSIKFTASDGSNTTLIPIKADGTFEGEAPVGKVRVSLQVSGGVGDHSDQSAVAKTFGIDPSFLASATNARSLEAEIPAGGKNDLSFDFSPGKGGSSPGKGKRGPGGGH